jgi:hypothetical protein
VSPTQRTLKKLRDEGWRAAIVEKWNPHARIRQDLFGLLDIVAIRGKETKGVQCTTLSNLSPRIQKFADSDMTGLLRDAGWLLECWGWRKLKTGWEPKVVNVS